MASAEAASSGGPTRLTAGYAMRAATPIRGSSPRNTNRQPMVSPMIPAMAGPMTPGMTHAVDSVANICGRRRSGRRRPMAT